MNLSPHEISFSCELRDGPDGPYAPGDPAPRWDFFFLFDDDGNIFMMQSVFEDYMQDPGNPGHYSSRITSELIDILDPDMAPKIIARQKLS